MQEWQQAEAALDRTRCPDLYFFGITPDEYRSLKQISRLVTLVDRSIGSILSCLERVGLTDNPVIVHTSDHGDMMDVHHSRVGRLKTTRLPRRGALIFVPS
jgi:membrane-anchored protein YejM (alkaline phosphatase superfamily)